MTYEGGNIELFFTIVRDLPSGPHKIVLYEEGEKRYMKIIEGGTGAEKLRIPVPAPESRKDG